MFLTVVGCLDVQNAAFTKLACMIWGISLLLQRIIIRTFLIFIGAHQASQVAKLFLQVSEHLLKDVIANFVIPKKMLTFAVKWRNIVLT